MEFTKLPQQGNNILKSFEVDLEKGKSFMIGQKDKSGKNVKTADGWKPVSSRGHLVTHNHDGSSKSSPVKENENQKASIEVKQVEKHDTQAESIQKESSLNNYAAEVNSRLGDGRVALSTDDIESIPGIRIGITQLRTTRGKEDIQARVTVDIANLEHFNKNHRNTIQRLQSHPNEVRNYTDRPVTASQLIDSYHQLMRDNNNTINDKRVLSEKSKQIASDILDGLDLTKLKGQHLACIKATGRGLLTPHFSISDTNNKQELEAAIKSYSGSKKIIDMGKKNSILGTTNPLLTALVVKKLLSNK